MKDLLGQEVAESAPPRVKGNPCLSLYGQGPAGKTCKRCVHLYQGNSRWKHLKCRKRDKRRGDGSDHREDWPACGKYEEAGKKFLDPLPPGAFE